jgi:hypothetical protein
MRYEFRRTDIEKLRRAVRDKEIADLKLLVHEWEHQANSVLERLTKLEEAWDFLADWWSDAPAGGILLYRDEPEDSAHLRTYPTKLDGEETTVLLVAPHEHPLDAVQAHMREERTVPHPPSSYYDGLGGR